MKARNSSIVSCRKRKKTEDGEPSIKWASWKGDMLYYYVILLKVDWMYSLLRKSPLKWSLVNR